VSKHPIQNEGMCGVKKEGPLAKKKKDGKVKEDWGEEMGMEM